MNAEPSIAGRVLIGYAILGSFLSGTSQEIATAATSILTDIGKPDVMAAIYKTKTGKMPPSNYMEDPDTIAEYTSLKEQVRLLIQQVFDDAKQIDQQKRSEALQQLKIRLSHSNDKHPCGSVAELAQKLGCSKNDVRRYKADGTLDKRLAEAGVTA